MPARKRGHERRLRNGEKTVSAERDGRGRFTGAVAGPGRPLGVPNKATPLRESFNAVFGRIGGEEMLLRLARQYPRDFMQMMIRLEPRLAQVGVEGALDVDVHVSGPPVRIVLPHNGRCDPALLGDVAASDVASAVAFMTDDQVRELAFTVCEEWEKRKLDGKGSNNG